MRAVIDVEMPKLRRCPQCGGNMFFYTDLENWYAECVECSYRCDLKSVAESEEIPSQMEKESAVEDKP